MITVLIIGLDGATWDVISPLAEEGKLSTLKKLMENGVWGELECTIPPVTGPAWVSFATEKNLRKNGVFDFLNQRKGGYNPKPVNSNDFLGKSI